MWNVESQVGTVGDLKTEEQRELLSLHQFQSPVRKIYVTAQENAIIAFEETASTNSGLILRTQVE